MPSNSTPSPKAEISGLAPAWRLMRGYRGLFGWAAAALFVSTVFQFLTPLIGSAAIDFSLTDQGENSNRLLAFVIKTIGGGAFIKEHLWVAAVAMAGFAILGGVFNYYQKLAAAKASDGICKRLKDQLYDHIQRLDNRYLDQSQTGDLLQRCTSDVETIRIFLAAHVVEIGRSVVLILAVLPIMLSMHVGLTLVSMGLIPFIILYSYVYTKRVKHVFKEVDEAEGRLTTVVQENITGIRVVRAFGRHDFEIEKFAKPNGEYRDTGIHLIRLMSWFWSISDLVCLLQIGIALFASAYLAIQGSATVGTLFAFLALMNMVLWPVRMIGRILTDFGKTSVALSRIEEILTHPFETETDNASVHPKGPASGAIRFANVSFSHEEDGDPTVRDIDFEVNAGETLAILGPSGSGKTTLMHLLLRFYDCDSGTISIDGVDIRKLERAYLRDQFGVVLQEPFLYSRSIAHNIAFGVGGAKQMEIESAARAACIHDTIQTFSEGYQTEIGERGISLSGGQRQRVALSRALLRNPPVLLLDDALSAVDAETENSIIEALKKRHGNRTTIVIAHRLSTLAHADKIIVLENGRITQTGNHRSLSQEPGLYQRLWNIQTQLEASLAAETR
ncbi:ABC transporter ATP-binding protein [Pelagicoccus sp. SDUM812003]|uniref:ABC transporter ATP-binding protein n=1 Tax=Pelagicoccus sp. SDUM812003 TaxID=3041267 RepID=UPI00280F1218|nr:ABC transporter ATP-binding protein [Pelagicoccus sp. SDUM812003]MDQ8202815.1 ABC transporter ATP-binding protein [Pelagicoccus sp. SDUM812003]